jgi:hypothetical protein
MLYKVNEDYKGAVMIGDRSYSASQIIRDEGTNSRMTKSIEKLLILEESPISLFEETPLLPAPAPAPAPENPNPKASEKGGK